MPRTADETYDEVVGATAPWLALGLAAAHACLTVIDATVLAGPHRLVAVATTASATLVFLIGFALIRRWPVSLVLAHPVTASMILFTVAVAVAPLVITKDPIHSMQVLLAVAGAGAVLLSLRWLAATLYLSWGAWGAAAVFVGGNAAWLRYVVALTISTALAVGVNMLFRRVIGDLTRARAAEEAAAVRDDLTGLTNRRGLAMLGTQITEHARRTGNAVHCIFVDIDGLSTINDTLGREAGDDVVCAVAETLRHVTRATDVVTRWSGDEFCVVGPGPGMPPVELERRLRETMLLDPPVPVEAWVPGVSAGGAMLAPWDSGTVETLLAKADHEMFLRRALRRESTSAAMRRAKAE